MKIIFLLLITLIHFSASADEQTFRDNQGFISCFKKDDKTYFFDWDHFVKTPKKVVRYFEISDFNRLGQGHLRSCHDQRFLTSIPSEILKPLETIKSDLPEEVLFSISQIENGAYIYRTEISAEEYIQNRRGIFKKDSPEVLSKLRHDVGDAFAEEIINQFTSELIPKHLSCSDLIGTCDFYLCQEQKNPCGLDGYNLNFGYKYCSRSKFRLLENMKSEEGKNWTTKVFRCLEKKNLETSKNLQDSDLMCSTIQKMAYDSHPECYFEAGFCKLKLSDKHKIVNLIKGELFSIESLKQGFDLLKMCAEER